jgi:hypothetical protein
MLLVILFAMLSVICFAESSETNAAIRFEAVDVFVDSQDKSFAAYQLEFSVTNGGAKIVGIESGEHPAFREAPLYDPKAMQHERVVIAAFSTDKQLPSGKTRVATIHLQVSGDAEPKFELRLQVIADSNGKKISAKTSFEMRAKK